MESLKFSSVQTVRDLIIYAKNMYKQEDLYNYFNKLINEDNFDDITSLIIDPSGKSEEDMLYYDAVLILLYLEAITISEAIRYVNNISENKNTITNLLIIEMGFANVDGKIVKRKLKVIDYIPRVYYGRKDVLSYKDRENISNETIRLLEEYNKSFNKYTATLKSLIPSSSESEDINIIEDFSDIFMSVNNKKAKIEDYIPTISLILNEINISSTAMESSIIDNTGNKITVTFNHAKPDNYSYIKDLLKNIMQRTINYN